MVYDLEPGRPLGPGRVIRKPQAGDQRRFIDHWLLPDGKHYVWSGPREPPIDRRVELFDVTSGKLLWSIPVKAVANASSPMCLLSEDLKHLWTSNDDIPARLYDLSTRNPPKSVDESPYSISADGKWMAFWKMLDQSNLLPHVSLRPAPGDRDWVHFSCEDFRAPAGGSYLFSPDGRWLAWGNLNGTIFLVDLPLLVKRVREFDADMAHAKE